MCASSYHISSKAQIRNNRKVTSGIRNLKIEQLLYPISSKAQISNNGNMTSGIRSLKLNNYCNLQTEKLL